MSGAPHQLSTKAPTQTLPPRPGAGRRRLHAFIAVEKPLPSASNGSSTAEKSCSSLVGDASFEFTPAGRPFGHTDHARSERSVCESVPVMWGALLITAHCLLLTASCTAAGTARALSTSYSGPSSAGFDSSTKPSRGPLEHVPDPPSKMTGRLARRDTDTESSSTESGDTKPGTSTRTPRPRPPPEVKTGVTRPPRHEHHRLGSRYGGVQLSDRYGELHTQTDHLLAHVRDQPGPRRNTIAWLVHLQKQRDREEELAAMSPRFQSSTASQHATRWQGKLWLARRHGDHDEAQRLKQHLDGFLAKPQNKALRAVTAAEQQDEPLRAVTAAEQQDEPLRAVTAAEQQHAGNVNGARLRHTGILTAAHVQRARETWASQRPPSTYRKVPKRRKRQTHTIERNAVDRNTVRPGQFRGQVALGRAKQQTRPTDSSKAGEEGREIRKRTRWQRVYDKERHQPLPMLRRPAERSHSLLSEGTAHSHHSDQGGGDDRLRSKRKRLSRQHTTPSYGPSDVSASSHASTSRTEGPTPEKSSQGSKTQHTHSGDPQAPRHGSSGMPRSSVQSLHLLDSSLDFGSLFSHSTPSTTGSHGSHGSHGMPGVEQHAQTVWSAHEGPHWQHVNGDHAHTPQAVQQHSSQLEESTPGQLPEGLGSQSTSNGRTKPSLAAWLRELEGTSLETWMRQQGPPAPRLARG